MNSLVSPCTVIFPSHFLPQPLDVVVSFFTRCFSAWLDDSWDRTSCGSSEQGQQCGSFCVTLFGLAGENLDRAPEPLPNPPPLLLPNQPPAGRPLSPLQRYEAVRRRRDRTRPEEVEDLRFSSSAARRVSGGRERRPGGGRHRGRRGD
jgi:hypothetical protein